MRAGNDCVRFLTTDGWVDLSGSGYLAHAGVPLLAVTAAGLTTTMVCPPYTIGDNPRPAAMLPGVDLDVAWRVRESPVGPFLWHQFFRAGRELARPAETSGNRMAITCSFADMLRILYDQTAFEEVEDGLTIDGRVGAVACLAGLLGFPDALRLQAHTKQVTAVLITWAQAATVPEVRPREGQREVEHAR